MSRLGFYLMCGALCSLVVGLQGDGGSVTITSTPSPNTTTPPTTKPPTTTPTTTKPPTTTPPTTKPPTTTPPTTTPPTTTPPTTTPPTTTPTPKPTPVPPTPKPTPKPNPGPPTQGTWSWTENNITCVVVQFAAKLNITYTKINGTSPVHRLLNVPANATQVGGSCSANNGSEQWLALSWSEDFHVINMTLDFLRNGTNYSIKNLNVSLPNELFPDAPFNVSVKLSYGPLWQTPLATSYRCGVPIELNKTAEQPTAIVATLTVSQLQEEAFRTAKGTGFSAARDCGNGDIPDAVPIAVGCALGGLVVVVLVAYLVARRRSAARGYLSM